MYDVGIIGAGPSGATLARLLGKRFKVLLIDNQRCKCCGGILSPESQRMFAQLDIAIPKKVLVHPQPFSVAVLDTATKLIKHYPRQYVNIDRIAFDEWLRSLLPENVDVRSNCRFEALDTETLNSTNKPLRKIYFTDKQGRKHSEQVKLLVGADGAYSAVRNSYFGTGNMVLPKRYIAIQDRFTKDKVDISNLSIDFWNDYTGVFDSELSDFYAWTIPKNNVLLVGAALPLQKQCRQKFEHFKTKMADFGLRLGKPFHREAGAMFRPMSNNSIYLGTGSVALIGEAAGLISPSSAEGISFAMASASALSESFLSDGTFSPHLYRKKTSPLLWKIFFRQFKIPAMFNPLFRKWIMKSGITALDSREK